MARCSRYSCRLTRRGAYMGRAGRQVASNGLMTREAEWITMKRSKGQRQGTRTILRRGRHERGRVNISRIMHDYSEGDRVAIVLDGGQQMGMPHRRFQGRTGFIQGRQGKAWVVAVKDGNMQKTVVARPEHLRPLE
jgi:large subunit ribosomal protein L21e